MEKKIPSHFQIIHSDGRLVQVEAIPRHCTRNVVYLPLTLKICQYGQTIARYKLEIRSTSINAKK